MNRHMPVQKAHIPLGDAMGGFASRLSSGLYLQSDGTFSTSPPPGAQIVPSPGLVLPVSPSDLTTIKDTLTSVSEGIKDATKQGSKVKRLLDDLGISQTEIMSLAKQLGDVAAQIASVIPYVALAVSLAKMLGLLKSGPSSDPAVLEKLTKIDEHLSAIDRKWQGLFAEGNANAVIKANEAARSYAFRTIGLETLPYQSAQWQAQDDALRGLIDHAVFDAGVELANLMRTGLWESQQPGLIAGEDGGLPTGWDPLRPFRLFHAPEPGRPLVLAEPEKVGSHPQFDHRLMVRAVPSMVQAYLLTLETLEPEYRTTGRWRDTLHGLAGAVETLMQVMRSTSVGRTHFTVDDVPEYGWGALGLAPEPPRFDVGGFDLAASRTISWTWPTPGFAGVWDGGSTEVTIAAMTYNFAPAARWEPDGPGGRYRMANREDVVQQLNSESDQRYAALLQASGYLELLQTASLLRYQCVPPAESETVRAGFGSSATARGRSDVSVTSRAVFPLKPITTTAPRYAQDLSVTARLTTQSPLRSAGGVAYRLYLRTLSARAADCRSDYATFYRDEADADAEGVGFRRCTTTGAPLSQVQLRLDPGSDGPAWTPRGVVEITGDDHGVTLEADTFDIWVPVPDLVGPGIASGVDATRRRNPYLDRSGSGGGTSGGWLDAVVSDRFDAAEVLTVVGGGGGSDVALEPPGRLGAKELEDPLGPRRNLLRGQRVTVWPSLVWDGPLLTVRVRSVAEMGNFDLYLVLEELLPGGQWRHVHHRIPVVGQTTYVPQSFLDEEAALVAQAERFWRDFDRHYSISHEPGIGDVVSNLVRGDIRAEHTIVALRDAARSSAPELLGERLRAWGMGEHGA